MTSRLSVSSGSGEERAKWGQRLGSAAERGVSTVVCRELLSNPTGAAKCVSSDQQLLPVGIAPDGFDGNPLCRLLSRCAAPAARHVGTSQAAGPPGKTVIVYHAACRALPRFGTPNKGSRAGSCVRRDGCVSRDESGQVACASSRAGASASAYVPHSAGIREACAGFRRLRPRGLCRS